MLFLKPRIKPNANPAVVIKAELLCELLSKVCGFSVTERLVVLHDRAFKIHFVLGGLCQPQSHNQEGLSAQRKNILMVHYFEKTLEKVNLD